MRAFKPNFEVAIRSKEERDRRGGGKRTWTASQPPSHAEAAADAKPGTPDGRDMVLAPNGTPGRGRKRPRPLGALPPLDDAISNDDDPLARSIFKAIGLTLEPRARSIFKAMRLTLEPRSSELDSGTSSVAAPGRVGPLVSPQERTKLLSLAAPSSSDQQQGFSLRVTTAVLAIVNSASDLRAATLDDVLDELQRVDASLTLVDVRPVMRWVKAGCPDLEEKLFGTLLSLLTPSVAQANNLVALRERCLRERARGA